jgi:Uma2 family endonuclease
MSPAAAVTESQPLILHLGPIMQKMSDHEYYEFCRLNAEWRIERTAEGDLVIMPTTGGRTGRRNFALTGQLSRWVEADGTGVGFDSSTGFTLPNGAKRSPDAAWIPRSRWDALTSEGQEEFPPLCPDFVVELRSRTDSLRFLQKKMEEYIANGARLGWLIDPLNRNVYVYQPDAEILCLEHPAELSGEPLLPGFRLNLQTIWS